MKTKSIQVIKNSTCPSLSNKSRLGYQLGCTTDNKLCIKVISNDGGGNFSKDWIAWDDIQRALKSSPKDEPLNSYVLSRLYKQNNPNNWGFLWAVLVHLKIVHPILNSRSYELLDLKATQATFKQLISSKTISKKKVSKKRTSTRKKKPAK